uniref:Reverse transcriptase domain-containing protein n=1 Tax=Fagus sylvatica TaxID=28930 RepID=A0A2N9GD74_FAGSY
MHELQRLEEKENQGLLTTEEKSYRLGTQAELEKTLLLDEVSWRQKSRVQWLKEGDKNTKFFQRTANAHRRNNYIESLQHGDQQWKFESEIRDGIVNFYQDLYSEREAWRPMLGGVEFNTINSAEATELEVPFSEEEVVTALNQMSGEKAPGPDGYTIAFYKHCWDIVKLDVLNSLQEFHEHECLKRSLNATFVVLIPKKPGVLDVKDFRPICLIGSVYKILSKVLANRLKVVLGAVLSPTQNAFIQGRQITESVLIANECLDNRLKSGIPGLLCKLDVEKAYDHVNWDFLMYMLERCGFGAKWHNWMYFCLSTVRFSILINGTPCGFFNSTRGIRQGDSLSPLLFVLVMEALSRLMDKAVVEHLLEGFAVNSYNRPDLKISHLLFADDTLIFCGADRVQLLHLKGVLMCFEAVSGLHINLGKSEIVPVGTVHGIQDLAQVIGGRITTLPMKYLGLPLGARYKSKEIWNPILEKMERRLAGWKKVILIQGSVAKRIEKIQRDFLWGGLGEEFKYHLVNSRTICTPLSIGGLGIRQTILFNQALLGKWLWRFATENTAFWRQVIASKYGVGNGDWYTKEDRGGYGVCLWKHIRSGWQQFSRHVSFSIGSGERVSFWHDRWYGEGVMKDLFPTLYHIAQNKQAVLSDYLNWHNEEMVWSVTLLRALQDWELDDFTTFMENLYKMRIKQNDADQMQWDHTGSGLFEVRSFYHILCGGNRTFLGRVFGELKFPPRWHFLLGWQHMENTSQ